MRRVLFSLVAILFFCTSLQAQTRSVSGKVTDSKTGNPIQGATVTVQGSATAVQTDANGRYTLNNFPSNATLLFSIVGYGQKALKPGASATFDVALEESATQLTEVVVTALGQSREKKSLGYSTTTFKTDDINRTSPVSMFDGLQGKVAGVDISNVSGNPGGSTKVILRGYSSLGGNNQPLYVVDGVPVSDVRPGSEGIDPDGTNNKGTGQDIIGVPGYDFGNTANDINPNDIESMTVLKGAAATSLYGSRASNGVIIITTKKGKSGRLKVDFSSSAIFSDPLILPKMQDQFGQGWEASFIPSENGSWGPRLDGVNRLWGAPVDNSQLLKPFSFVKDNFRDAYETGREFNNTVSFQGGNNNTTFFFSYGNAFSDGIVPSDNDSYRRNSLSLRTTTRIDRFTGEGSFNYVNKAQRFVEVGQSASGVGGSFFEQLLQIPVDIPIKDHRDYKNKFFNVDNFFTPFAENPYYTLFENGGRSRNDRFFGNINLQYKIMDGITIQAQQGIDNSNSTTKTWRNKNAPTPGSWNAGNNPESAARSADIGSVQEGSQKYYEYDTKLDVLVKKRINDDFDIDAIAGANYNERGSDVLYTYIEDLALPGFFDISNGVNPPQSSHYKSKQSIFGVFGSATLNYKDFLYLTLTGRNDWSSTLPKGKNSYFYPSANVSVLLTNLLDPSVKEIVNYAKIRASLGRTGKDAPIYRVYDVISSQVVLLPFGQISFPFSGVPGYTLNDRLGNQTLKPEISREWELGGEFKLWDSRIGIDIAYYHKVSDGQIINVPIAPTTGYTSVTLNFGQVRNQGIELSAQITPVRLKQFTWDINYVFTQNRNEVLELPTGLDRVTLNNAYDANLEARLNQPLGVFYAPSVRRDPEGRVIVDANTGFPAVTTEDVYFGTAQRDYTMGLSNTLTYKNLRLGFSLDYRKGGVFYSSTSELLLFTGNHYSTVYNGRKPFIIPNSVNESFDAQGKPVYTENKTVLDEVHQDDYYYQNSNRGMFYDRTILDKTFLKLRDVTLSYTLPSTWAKKISADRIVVTAIGRNLWVSLPKSNKIVDPESSNFGRDIASEFGEFRVGPTPRSYGASVRISF
ncbi:SusC/RagA family TonB-linked outer membrane protein [Paraflavitalea sp. CAU 1676]|uniref:SusC/RagA family TonB-linked outer membrane protein n=1 Tax=Paraflavitalea sp. CAU 1676 TaxID=3032598 RepID=UPI0023DBD39D|nr:SusC/RagA family TonB-linked outer membrane protein [Paraflavitalea sp. CAU 1676]MDF2188209.1 SusC/RagA family TonB-linked outer membrane protein [Paraflavitalea sp. CAU 1676]